MGCAAPGAKAEVRYRSLPRGKGRTDLFRMREMRAHRRLEVHHEFTQLAIPCTWDQHGIDGGEQFLMVGDLICDIGRVEACAIELAKNVSPGCAVIAKV